MPKKTPSFVKIIGRLLKEAFSYAPIKFIGLYGGFAISGMLFSLMVYFKANVFDAVVQFTQGDTRLSPILLTLGALFTLEIVIASVNGFANYIAETYDANMAKLINGKINDKLGKLPQIDFETPSKLDLIERAKSGGHYAMGFLNSAMDLVFMYAPVFVFMGVYLFYLKTLLLGALLFIFIPVLYTQWVKMRTMRTVELETAPLRRAYTHYAACAGGKAAFKETRVLGAFSYFRSLFKKTFFEAEDKRFQAEVRSSLWEASARLVSVLGYIGVLYLLFEALKSGDITVGTFAAVFYTVDELYKILEEALVSRFGPMAMQYGKLASFYEFLELPEMEQTTLSAYDEEAFKALHFKDVHFAYPGCESALKGVSFTVNRGERIAVVGVNGAGKSTLTKLIAGLLTPTEGHIVWEGLPESKRRTEDFTQLFQRYQRYEMCLRDNVCLSDYDTLLDDASLGEALNAVGLSLEGPFPEGGETILSKTFGSTDLSGGQWQRLALARACHRHAPIVLLDEPTASIDPVMEASLYQLFHKIMAERTSFVVTHRMGAVQYVDKVLLLDDGRVHGFGTHEELMASNPLYQTLRS